MVFIVLQVGELSGEIWFMFRNKGKMFELWETIRILVVGVNKEYVYYLGILLLKRMKK